MTRKSRWAFVALACSVAFFGLGVLALAAKEKPEPVTAKFLASADHVRGAKDRTLRLQKVVIQPGAKLDTHHHPGTQIARIAHGTLTYTVHEGKVTVRKGDAADGGTKVRKITAGHKAKLHAGEWIVEQPTDHHSAENRGKTKVVIYLANLFPTGSPTSISG